MMEKREFNKQNLIKAADNIYFIPNSTPLNVQLVNFQHNKENLGSLLMNTVKFRALSLSKIY